MSDVSNYQKSLRYLKRKALNGNFYSAYQLYEYYRDGKFVDQDSELEKKFFDIAYSYFERQKIYLESIHIENFRVFNDASFVEFDKNLNIFVGNNGAGKTTVLDALSMSLSWLVNAISKNGGVGSLIDESDINIYNELPYSNITSCIKFNDHINAYLELSQSRGGVHKKKNHLLEFRKIGAFYKLVNTVDNRFNMPLFAYYNVLRSFDVSSKDMVLSVGSVAADNFDKFKGYNNSLSGKTDFSSFVEWYKTLDDIHARRKLAKVELSASEYSNIISRLAEIDDEKSDEIIRLLKLIPVNVDAFNKNNTQNHSVDTIQKVKAALNSVISSFMVGYGSLELVLEPKFDLTIVKNNRKISVLQLSQGEKTLLALVIDIAMRLFLLNPSLENPLEGEGIILIDEFDLHLHPKWQREMVKNLPLAFPNCQFFLTTHSPVVLGEVKPNQIYLLNSEHGEITVIKPKQSYGLSSNEILNELMNNDGEYQQLGRNIDVDNAINHIFYLIELEDDESIKKARDEVINLENALNGEIPELVQAKIMLDLMD